MLRMVFVLVLAATVGAYVTLAFASPQTARDIGIVYGATIGTIAAGLHMTREDRE